MKFDYIIGNPPYQEDKENTSDKQLYNFFIDEAYKMADKVEMITPARFLFGAGKTPKQWNKKMLADEHLKVLFFEQDSTKVFQNKTIKGGIAITYHDVNKCFGPIEVFSSFNELRDLRKRISPFVDNECLSSIMIPQNRFDLEKLYSDYPSCRDVISSNGKERRIVTSAFDKLPIFHEDKESEDDLQIVGIKGSNHRQTKWVDKQYIEDNGNLYCFKTILPAANGAGTFGEVLSNPQVIPPSSGYTQSFVGIGSFTNEEEAKAVMKYIKGKFVRALLGILKITQHNTPEKWKYVPLQDFSSESDIDWTKSIEEIDQQLYEKYGLSQEEIDFIETHVKEMN